MSKMYAVFGLGSFGRSVALTLESFGCNVMVVDKNPEKIRDIADDVTYAVCADVSHPEALENLGVRHIDVAVIGVSESLEASILVTILSKEMGIPHVIAKAVDELQATILRKVGADAIIFPERDAGNFLAKRLLSKAFSDWIEVSDEYSMMHVGVPDSWVGKSLVEVGVRENFNVNVVGIIHNKDVEIDFDPSLPLTKGGTLLVVGSNANLKRIDELSDSHQTFTEDLIPSEEDDR